MSKSDLAARPMFNRVPDAIEAHLTIVFTALAVSQAIQSRTGLSIAKVIKQLRPLRSATINMNGATQTFPPAIPHTDRKIFTDLGLNPGDEAKSLNSGLRLTGSPCARAVLIAP